MATNQNSNKEKEVKKTAAKTTAAKKTAATAAKTTAVKKTAATAAKPTAAKKTAAAAAKPTAAKKTAATAAKPTAAKKTAATASKTTAAKKTAATAAKPTVAKKTAATASKTTAAKKTAATASKTTAAKKTAATASKPTAAKKTAATAAKTTAAKKTAATASKPTAAKKTAATAAKPTAAKKTAATAAKTTAAKKTAATAAKTTAVIPEVVDENPFEANLETAVVIEDSVEEKASVSYEVSVAEKGVETIIREYKEESSDSDTTISEKETQTIFQGLTQVNAHRVEEKKTRPKNKTVIAVAAAVCLAVIFTIVGISKCGSSSSGKKLNYNELTIDEAMTEAKKQISSKNYAEALRILSTRDIEGTDKVASSIREKINSLMTEAVSEADKNGKQDQIIGLVSEYRKTGKYPEDIRILSFGKAKDEKGKFTPFQNTMDFEKADTVEKMVNEGRTQEVIDLAKKMIQNRQFAEAYDLLNLLDLENPLNKVFADQIDSLKKEAVEGALKEDASVRNKFLELADWYAKNGHFELYDIIQNTADELDGLGDEEAAGLKKK